MEYSEGRVDNCKGSAAVDSDFSHDFVFVEVVVAVEEARYLSKEEWQRQVPVSVKAHQLY